MKPDRCFEDIKIHLTSILGEFKLELEHLLYYFFNRNICRRFAPARLRQPPSTAVNSNLV